MLSYEPILTSSSSISKAFNDGMLMVATQSYAQNAVIKCVFSLRKVKDFGKEDTRKRPKVAH